METAIKEHPILFSGPMVKAILEGKKTQTRRTVKRNDVDLATDVDELADCWRFSYQYGNGIAWTDLDCPYGKPGDRLWVRETWVETCDIYANGVIAYKADGVGRTYLCENGGDGDPIGLDGPTILPQEVCEPVKWKSSIHMPRWASRITLQVTNVRVERVQEISEEDAIAEGVSKHDGSVCIGETHRAEFRCLWDSINGKKHPWASNPWVWVVEFKKV